MKEVARMLHITNGDSAAERIRQSGLAGKVLPWRDVLDEGPVPAGLGLEEMSAVRARFLAGCGWGAPDRALEEFAARDSALARFREHDEAVLWFEHDLYDQLQLIQILDWFRGRELGGTKLSLIAIGEFPGIRQFKGLGQLTPPQMASLFPARHAVSEEEMALAGEAWRAFTSPDPRAIESLLSADSSALPFLAAALKRHLEQFPSLRNGLSRTERQILEVVVSGVHSRRQIFLREQQMEEAPFMGDATFRRHLDGLAHARVPLLDAIESQVVLTQTGKEVFENREDHVRLNGIDRWLGGVHLRDGAAVWRWDEQRRLLHRAA